jgi:cysteinyl-tRNA synthetase
LKAGARITLSEEKKNPTDFALWKFSSHEGAKRQQEWQSPWGMGFPGWHIECSAMSRALLGKHLDIHTGGIDHIPVHHNNEIAQSECGSGEKFVNIWMHNAFLTIDGNRIGKSVGNAITLRELVEKGYDPLALRYLFLSAHYRSQMNFTYESLDAAQTALKRLRTFVAEHYDEKVEPIPAVLHQIQEACADDLATPQAIAALFAMQSFSAYKDPERASTLVAADAFLGLKLKQNNSKEETPEAVATLLAEREKARNEKRWKDSDSIRDAIGEIGYSVKDTKDGQKVEKK